LRTWISRKTFGEMFDECVGEETIQMVLDMTKGYCISYFLRHKENDLYGEMKNEDSYVIQNLIWDIEHQKFVTHLVPSPAPIRPPVLVCYNEFASPNPSR